MRYAFTNFTNNPFEGRYGGVPYPFAPGETREFDSDKHQMLIIMAKQLADHELLKNIKSVGKNPNDQERYGKSLDADGNIYELTIEDRKSLMRRAIGELVDVAVPVPADQMEESEVGATVGETELKGQVAELKSMVESLTAALGKVVSQPVAGPVPPVTPQVVDRPEGAVTPAETEEAKTEVEAPAPQVTTPIPADAQNVEQVDMGMTRELLFDMATEAGLNPTQEMTKEMLVDLLNTKDLNVNGPVE